MSSGQKATILVVALGLLGLTAWLLLSPATRYTAGLPDAYHVVREVEGDSGSIFLHFKAWGIGGGHEAAWASLDPEAAVPDSSRDLLIHDVPGGIVYRAHGDSLHLMHEVTAPPGGFVAPVAVEVVRLRASVLNEIHENPESVGAMVLR